jgi:hypothetical protein
MRQPDEPAGALAFARLIEGAGQPAALVLMHQPAMGTTTAKSRTTTMSARNSTAPWLDSGMSEVRDKARTIRLHLHDRSEW